MIKKFKKVQGRYIEKIYGQDRLAYAMSDSKDLYDLVEWAERGGYPGSIIEFYDFSDGEVYAPFEKREDVMYAAPSFLNGVYYILQADYKAKMVTLFGYKPGEKPEVVEEFNLEDVDLYNLTIIGEKINVISQNGKVFKSYYPEKFEITLDAHETVCFMTDDKIYIEAWVEEGWDELNKCAGKDYKYYTKIIVKDYEGNKISEGIGSIHQASDGTYWLS